jgi:N-acetylmuramoyl-L-alanine amidase
LRYDILGGAVSLLLAAPALADAPTSPSEAAPVAVGAHVERLPQGARLVFDLSRTVDARAFVLENPDRVVIEAPQINFQLDPALGNTRKFGGLVKTFRFGAYAAGRSRIVIDLGGPAQVQKVAATAIAGRDAAHLVIQLVRADRASFHQAALQGAALGAAAVPAAPVLPATGDAKPVVVIDPGHGGIDPGASGLGGLLEKDLTFDFAGALAAKLRDTGRYTVVLTRTNDTFVSLRDRVKLTRDAKAALFVSIHADTVAEGDAVSGATVYTAADRASDAEAARVAESENKADQQAGVEAAPDASEINDILADLTRRETRTFSHSFQRTLTGYWQKIAHLNKNPERSAGFWVLKAPDVPSVLLELGYLSSASDVAALTSPQWRDKTTAAITASINSFFDARGHGVPAAVAQAAPDGTNAGAADPDRTAVVTLRPHL